MDTVVQPETEDSGEQKSNTLLFLDSNFSLVWLLLPTG